MSTAKRPRACDHCHSIKIKCELGTVGGVGPCERCIRLGKDCKVSPPKTQKSRVAELEAEVEKLTRLLRIQNIEPSSTASSSPGDGDSQSASSPDAGDSYSTMQKKRRLDDTDFSTRESTPSMDSGEILCRLDSLVDQRTQKELLERYVFEVAPKMPLVPITGQNDYASVRANRPLLLQAAVYAASIGVLAYDLQDQIGKLNWKTLSQLAVREKKKSLEILQAIHITYLWYRTPKNQTHVSVFDLVQIADDMAREIGLSGPIVSLENSGFPSGGAMNNEDTWRAWLVCRFLACSTCIFKRKSDNYEWTEYDDISLQMMDYWPETVMGGHLVSHIVKSERLSERIAAESGFYDLDIATDIADPQNQSTRIRLQSAVLDVKVAMTPRRSSQLATLFLHATTLYLHESVLHTPTNKKSFTAPYLAEMLSVTDFPMPFVKQEHIASLEALRDSAHSLINCFLAFDIATQILLPAVPVTARVGYAQQILMKIYIATTAPGNTFGGFFDPQSLQIEKYHQLQADAYARVEAVDKNCGPTRVLSGVVRTREWYDQYRATYVSYPTPVSQTEFDASINDFEYNLDLSSFDDIPTEQWIGLDYVPANAPR